MRGTLPLGVVCMSTMWVLHQVSKKSCSTAGGSCVCVYGVSVARHELEIAFGVLVRGVSGDLVGESVILFRLSPSTPLPVQQQEPVP